MSVGGDVVALGLQTKDFDFFVKFIRDVVNASRQNLNERQPLYDCIFEHLNECKSHVDKYTNGLKIFVF